MVKQVQNQMCNYVSYVWLSFCYVFEMVMNWFADVFFGKILCCIYLSYSLWAGKFEHNLMKLNIYSASGGAVHVTCV